MVRQAIDHQRRAPNRERDRFEAYDQVWCVFDVEAPQPHPKLDAALRLASKHKVRCAVSNPCFELWLLLHFRDQFDYLTTADASRRLASCGCGYSPRAKHVDYASLEHSRLAAYDRAVRLDQRHDDGAAVQGRNPWTSVHTLVDALFSMA